MSGAALTLDPLLQQAGACIARYLEQARADGVDFEIRWKSAPAAGGEIIERQAVVIVQAD